MYTVYVPLLQARTSLNVSILFFEHGHAVVASQNFPLLEGQSHLTVSRYMRNNTVDEETGEDPWADEERMVQLDYYSVTKYG